MSSAADKFYAEVIRLLKEAQIPFLVGGAYALREYTGINRDTKDLDLFIRRAEVESIMEVCRQAGYRAEYAYPHWIAKVFHADAFVDLIYAAGNGLLQIDETWLDQARLGTYLDFEVQLCPPEELIAMKCYVMDRCRYDGADIHHLFRCCGAALDWDRLRSYFEEHYHVLLTHLLMFMFTYPGEVSVIPELLLRDLLDQARAERRQPSPDERVCRGPLLAKLDYLQDVEQWGYKDARQIGPLALTAADIECWTKGTI